MAKDSNESFFFDWIDMQHFNQLSPAEAERLAVLVEEMGEAVQMVGKILRHGYESYDPRIGPEQTNRKLLEMELGDVQSAINRMAEAKDVSLDLIAQRALQKQVMAKRWLHHQEETHARDLDHSNIAVAEAT